MSAEHAESGDVGNVFQFCRPGANPAENPTAAGLLLGLQLRRLRGDHTLQKVSTRAGFSIAKLSRLERGESPPKMRDVQKLLEIYEATGEDAATAVQLAHHATQPYWLHAYRDVASDWLERLIALESAASVLMTYEAKVVPGLVQTQDYARELFRGDLPAHLRCEVERRVDLRMERQRRFLDAPPRSVFFLEQGTLYRKVGSARVMVDQLQRLIDLTRTPYIGVRIITFDHTFASSVSSLTRLMFDSGGLPELIYNERHDGADYLTPAPDERARKGDPQKVSEMEVYKELLLGLMNIGTERQESRQLLLAAREHFRGQL
ncbi:transcriptional regulator with XRE-family HTH domain [Streptacidiphilus sp. BW17]|uniref:helix-turn-helix domain-containing protein n=1 Tax=Streptacidiphilus sp. BW17 TaxID=3156274 RepID=UPI0035194232